MICNGGDGLYLLQPVPFNRVIWSKLLNTSWLDNFKYNGKEKLKILKCFVVATLHRHGNAFTYFPTFIYIFEYF